MLEMASICFNSIPSASNSRIAPIALAIDAIETVYPRPNIDVYVVVSGDSDFTELIHKLRDHGKYTMGIGLHAATSDLLRRAWMNSSSTRRWWPKGWKTSPTSCNCPIGASFCAAR